MAFTETPKEKEKRLAFYAKNKAVADDKEAKANAEIKRKFNETTNTDTSKNTNPMGDTYKKGGKVMKKMKKYEDGGSIDSDVRARAMRSVEGLEGIKGADIEDETGMVKGSIKRNEYGDLYDSEMKATPKSAPSFKAKADKAGFTSAETKGGAALMTRKDRRSTPKAAPKAASKKSSGSGESTNYSSMIAAKKGGMMHSSASKRADGCATKGKTKGRMV
jgi:hypothetical protein